MNEAAKAEIAGKFVAARHAGAALPDYPGTPPATLDSAYAVQDAAIARFGGSIGGWKVGRIMPPLSDDLGADRLAGPIFSAAIARADAGAAGLVFSGGFGAAEAEFLIRLGGGIDPARRSYSLADAAAHIVAVHVGIEIASSPFPGINALGPLVTISDFGNNNGIIIGDAIADWRDCGFADWGVRLLIDGVEHGSGTAAAFPDGPVGSVRFLLENLAARRIPVADGCWVSSGAVTGVHVVAPGQTVEARFGSDYSVSCTIKAAPVS
ncbi:2-keto-4-pentenoate hydratase [Sphingomonas colocasiae]|uniref:2-keto-4-pentenoate hydratase n=1 Tax=Sphingomonas colocasiae TaxID=1848973 RepID=A0ABS7PSA7_9SPHN|nr:2-keto-4-pentenoate hydratase [Sphingomonas colocasiae]